MYILLYVDHPDDGYRWAEKRKLTVNPVTGSMQLVVIEETQEIVSPPPATQITRDTEVFAEPSRTAPLFSQIGDRELMSLGVRINFCLWRTQCR